MSGASASSPQLRRLSTRVALTATAIVAVAYLIISVLIVAWLTLSLTAQVDDRLSASLRIEAAVAAAIEAGEEAEAPPQPRPADGGEGRPDPAFGRERVVWTVAEDGTVSSNRTDLELPAEYATIIGPRTVTVDGAELRIDGAVTESGHVVVGESMDPVNDAQTTALIGLLVIAPFLLGAVFFGSLAIGRRVAMPIEQARQRQLAFTADASHELRTPLAVIEANASLALQSERDGSWYRAAFERVLEESRRMHRLIDDLLWLARFDSSEPAVASDPVDLGVLAQGAVERFRSIAEARSIELEVTGTRDGLTIEAPAAWVDQLIGVLLDNACKYTPEGGSVAIATERREGLVWLVVDDAGPGIPKAQRERIFDRFHRGTDEVHGTGLGLAIGDAVVQATDGRWAIEDSPLGGARMAVGWPGPEGMAESRS